MIEIDGCKFTVSKFKDNLFEDSVLFSLIAENDKQQKFIVYDFEHSVEPTEDEIHAAIQRVFNDYPFLRKNHAE